VVEWEVNRERPPGRDILHFRLGDARKARDKAIHECRAGGYVHSRAFEAHRHRKDR
jgi:hypothetical protein